MRWLKHKHMRSLARRFWGTVILLVLVVAVVVQLGREAFPMLDDYREVVARQASKPLGVLVEIGAIEAKWVGLRPNLKFRDIIMRTADGEQILTIGHAEGELNLLQSLREWQLVWRQLAFEQLRMQFQQESDGRWTLGGLDLARPRVDDGAAVQDPLDIFLLTRHLTVDESRFQFAFHTGHEAELAVPQLMMENEADFRRLTANFAVDGDQEAFSVIIEGKGNPRAEDELVVDGHVVLDNFPMEKAVAALNIASWDAASEGVWSEGHRLDAQLWLSGKPYRHMTLKGQLRADGLPLALPDKVQMPAGLSADLTGQWKTEEGWRLALQQAKVSWNQFAAPATNLIVSGGFEQPLRFQVDRLALEPWLGLVEQAGLLPERFEPLLEALAPKGELTRVLFETGAQTAGRFSFKTNLQGVAVEAYRGAPAISSLDGYLEATDSGGRMVIDSQNGFTMRYPQIYEQPMSYHRASGEVRWDVRQDLQRVDVSSGLLSLSGEDGLGRGYFKLQLPYGGDRGSRKAPQMTLLVGLQDSDAIFHSKYIPAKVPTALRDWLQGSVREGSISRAGFLWHGPLTPSAPTGRSVQLFGKVENGQLQFSPEWPTLRQLYGDLVLDNRELDVKIRRGTLDGNRIEQAVVKVRSPQDGGTGQLLHITGRTRGDLDNALRLVGNSPLADQLGPQLTNWRGSGEVQAEVKLTVPLGAKQPAEQDVTVNLSGVRLAMPDLRLMLDRVNGAFSYASATGLRADRLDFSLWGKEGHLSIESEHSQGRLQEVRIEGAGGAPLEQVADWLRRPELSRFATGAADFDLEAKIPLGRRSGAPAQAVALTLRSNLAGVAVDLPAPYGKAAEVERPISVAGRLAGSQHYKISYGDLVQLQFLLDDELKSLSLALGDEFAPLTPGYLDVTGRLGSVDLNQLRESLEESSGEPSTEGPVVLSMIGGGLPLAPRFDLHLDVLRLEQLALEQLDLKGEYLNGRWRAEVQSPHLTGELFVYEDGRPLRVNLDDLHFPGTTAEASAPEASMNDEHDGAGEEVSEDLLTSAADPVSLLKNIELSRLPAVDVSVASLTTADTDYGAWEFALRPVDSGIVLRNLRGRVLGLNFGGPSAEGEGGELVWLQSGGYNSTYLRGVVTSANLSDLLHQLGQAELLESESARFDVELLWPGAPDEPKLQQVEGTVAVDIRRGRFIRGAEAGNNPFLRLFGLLNFDTLARRLKLDFSDMYKEGMVFDAVTGEMRFAEGQLVIEEALRVESPSSTLQFAGVLDAESEQIDATLVATLPVTGNLAVAAAFVGGLPAALGVYAVGKLFKEQVDKVSSIRYRISGDWDEPRVRVDRIFESSTDREVRPVPPELPSAATGSGKNTRSLRPDLTPRPLGGEPAPEARVPPQQ